ncbi:MAG: transglutaminase-like protein [Acidobacteriales bacterium]|nr:transglutaminase-like protein [Terriglobales bacterium]
MRVQWVNPVPGFFILRTYNVLKCLVAAPAPTRITLDPANPIANKIQRYFELSLFAMIVTGFVALGGTGKLDPFSLLFVLCALGLRAFLFATHKDITLSVKTTSRLTIGYVIFYVLDFIGFSGNFVVATVHLVLFIMVVKLFSVQRERDHVYLAIISFLMILASAVLTVDSFFLAAFCLFLLLTVTTSISMEMRRSFADASKVPETSEFDASGKTLIAEGAPDSVSRMSRSISLAAATLVITIAFGAVAIFFVLPRVSRGYLSKLASSSNFSSGFSDEITLGEIGRIQQLDAVIMHVQFAEGARVPQDLKWRGVSLNVFNGKHWRNRSQVLAVRGEADGRLDLQSSRIRTLIVGNPATGAADGYQTLNYRVAMQPIGTTAFFVAPVANYVSSPVREFVVDSSGAITLNDPTRQIRTYTASSTIARPNAQQRSSVTADYPQPIKDNYLQLPLLHPRVAELAKTVTQNSNSTYEKASAIERYLQNTYGYTLDMEAIPDGVDAVTYFLFWRKKGHCEYFSSAMAIMLRTQGIPSRIVNGFRNGEFNDISGSYIIRAKDAHSWVEAYIPGYGWATFDPTPNVPVGETSTFSRMMLYADAMREFWNEWIVNYDFTHQESLGQSSISTTRHAFDSARKWMQDKYEAALDRVRSIQINVKRSPRKLGFSGIAALLSILLLLNARSIYRFIREFRLARKPAEAPRAAATIWYERMSRMLGRRGIEKGPAQTPQDFLRTIEDRKIQSSVAAFTEHYERARFGGSEEDAEKLPELYEEVETAAKH